MIRYGAFNAAFFCPTVTYLGCRPNRIFCKSQLICFQWQIPFHFVPTNATIRAAVSYASLQQQALFLSILNLFFLPSFPFPKNCSAALSGASTAGERGPTEDSVCRGKSWSHCLPRAWSNAVLERATDILRGMSRTDYYWDWQAEVLWHGPRSGHVDGLYHLPDRDRREAQVSILQSQEDRICQIIINQAGMV